MFAFAVSIILYAEALVGATSAASEKSQFFRLTVNGRMAFSAALFERAHLLFKKYFPYMFLIFGTDNRFAEGRTFEEL